MTSTTAETVSPAESAAFDAGYMDAVEGRDRSRIETFPDAMGAYQEGYDAGLVDKAKVVQPPGKRTRRRGIQLGAADLGAGVDAPGYVVGRVYHIPVGALHPDPDQPRRQFEPEALQALARDLLASGQLDPIEFRLGEGGGAVGEEADRLILVHGERRWRAAQLAGLETLEGLLERRPAGERDRRLKQITSNVHRADFTAWDWYCALSAMHEEMGMSSAEIAQELATRAVPGKGREAVSNFLRLKALPDWALALFEQGWLTPSHGKYLLTLKDHPRVWAALRAPIEAALAVPSEAGGADLSIATMVEMFVPAYEAAYISLDTGREVDGEWLEPLFYWENEAAIPCRECPQRVAVPVGGGRSRSFCMEADGACLKRLNAGIEAQAETPDRDDSPVPVEAQDIPAPLDTDQVKWMSERRAAERNRDAWLRRAVAQCEQGLRGAAVDQLLTLLVWSTEQADWHRQVSDPAEMAKALQQARAQQEGWGERITLAHLAVKVLALFSTTTRAAIALELNLDLDAATDEGDA